MPLQKSHGDHWGGDNIYILLFPAHLSKEYIEWSPSNLPLPLIRNDLRHTSVTGKTPHGFQAFSGFPA